MRYLVTHAVDFARTPSVPVVDAGSALDSAHPYTGMDNPSADVIDVAALPLQGQPAESSTIK